MEIISYNQQYDMPHTVIYYSENKEFKVIKKEFQSKQTGGKDSLQQKFDNSKNLSDILFLGKQLIHQLSQSESTYNQNLTKINKIIAKMNQKRKEAAGKKIMAKEITRDSTYEEIKLAKALAEKDCKFYTAYYCGWCTKQKNLLGKQAIELLNVIECHPNAYGYQSCAGISALPTLSVNGQTKVGFNDINQLKALLS